MVWQTCSKKCGSKNLPNLASMIKQRCRKKQTFRLCMFQRKTWLLFIKIIRLLFRSRLRCAHRAIRFCTLSGCICLGDYLPCSGFHTRLFELLRLQPLLRPHTVEINKIQSIPHVPYKVGRVWNSVEEDIFIAWLFF